MTSNYITTEPILIEPISIDLGKIIEHGESPTAIILATAIFTAVFLESLARLIKGILFVLNTTDFPNKDDSEM
jgi:hypothetical protein